MKIGDNYVNKKNKPTAMIPFWQQAVASIRPPNSISHFLVPSRDNETNLPECEPRKIELKKFSIIFPNLNNFENFQT